MPLAAAERISWMMFCPRHLDNPVFGEWTLAGRVRLSDEATGRLFGAENRLAA
jgi:hypothetical protein